jgi:hypothetical protein
MGLKTTFVFQNDQLIEARTLASRFAGLSDCAFLVFLVLHCKKMHIKVLGVEHAILRINLSINAKN